MAPDVRLIAILDPAAPGTDGLQAALAAEAGGATLLQVRMKNSAAADVLAWTERLVRALAIPVWVNDRVDVAWLGGAAGVHLGVEDLPAERVRRQAVRPLAIGVSVGTEAEAERASPVGADYWSIGSVYATGSKPDAGAPIGVTGFARVRGLAPAGVPCVAIGGITAERVPELRAAGAAGIAVINAVFGSADVTAATRRLRDAIDSR